MGDGKVIETRANPRPAQEATGFHNLVMVTEK